MNEIKKFLKFVEISTKLASLIPFLTGVGYAFLLNHSVNLKSTFIFLAAMLLFDMATTAINNYMDTREAKIQGSFPRFTMLIMIFAMGISAALIGLYLTYLHGLVVFFTGVFCFLVGIGYTFGPAPISKSPYGEVVSGCVMGFCIPFIAVFINSPSANYIAYSYAQHILSLQINIMGIFKLGIVTIPLICCIANVMLANNICDYEKDLATRYTLPRHIGIKNALLLYAAIYYTGYLAIVAASFLRIIPVFSLITLLTLSSVKQNITRLRERQSKEYTFHFCIHNFLLITLPYVLCIWIGALFEVSV